MYSGVAIAGSAGSMNPGPRPLGAPNDNGVLVLVVYLKPETENTRKKLN